MVSTHDAPWILCRCRSVASERLGNYDIPTEACAAGVTAEFKRNVLYVLNDPGDFDHVARWNGRLPSPQLSVPSFARVRPAASAAGYDGAESTGVPPLLGCGTHAPRSEWAHQASMGELNALAPRRSSPLSENTA